MWPGAVNRIYKSTLAIEREHLFLGTHAEYGYPVLLHKRVMREHMHILGNSGSGKTSRVITPLVTSLMRGDDSAIVIIDLKGDMALFEAVRIEAQRSGRTFKHFTNMLGRSSYVFNPLQQINSPVTSISQFVETLMEALRLNHGDGYGSRFFSSQSREWLLKTVQRFPNIASFKELYSKASPEFFRNEAEMDRCREAISVVQQVAEVIALNWKPTAGGSDQPQRDSIFMPDVVQRRQIVYFYLPAIGETSTVKEIASLALYALLAAVKANTELGSNQQTFLFIDEVQQMASEGFKLVFTQARSFGLSLIVSNQSEADLMTRQANRLLDTIRTNTQTKLYLSVDDPNTIKLLEKRSGVSGDGTRLNVNDINFYSSHPDYCICWITRDSGYTTYGGDWFGLKTGFHVSREEFEKRDNASWPASTEATIVAERTAQGVLSFVQGDEPVVSKPRFGSDLEAMPLKVSPDSKWAKRLNAIFARRFPGRDGHET